MPSSLHYEYRRGKNRNPKREAESTTAIGMNVAIPHAKSYAVKRPIVAVLNHKQV